ncbi:MBL fold metallo-hydrolase [Sunxiuqinia sp. A32]|uniref:MBL fold metallo-hydrolase n=1 Tax=Sunxiuqinia sp. A32 TaxID=3461496 RepID=UPI0040451A9E
MKLTVLTENVAGSKFYAEHGLSYFIEHEEISILFDAGHSNIFVRNAEKMGIDLLEKVDQIVLSHGHWDHGNGLKYIQNKPLLTHPKSFIKRYRKTDRTPLGLSMLKEEIEYQFILTTSKIPVQISNHIWYLGEIPRLTDFESQVTPFINENGDDDFVPDDSALAFILGESIVIVSGCSHSGICNICEYAKKVTGINKIHAVIGGFHLKHNNRQTKETIHYFHNENIQHLHPSHCTELPALAAFHDQFKISQLKTGQILEFL